MFSEGNDFYVACWPIVRFYFFFLLLCFKRRATMCKPGGIKEKKKEKVRLDAQPHTHTHTMRHSRT